MTVKVFTKEDIGCYIDGAYGFDHARQRLAELLTCVPQSSRVRQIIAELESEENIDYVYEAIEEALDVLSQYTSEEVVWMMEAGDLTLMEVEEI